jgi:SecD/SecF fusion protein
MYEKVGWKIVLIIVIVGMAFFFMFPPFGGMIPPGLQKVVFGKWPPAEGKLLLGEDLKGGLTMVMSVPNASQRDDVMEVLNRRVNSSGLKEIYVSALGDRQIQVRAPAEAPGLKELLKSAGTLEFRSEAPEREYVKYDESRKTARNTKVAPPPPSGFMLVEGKDPEGNPILGLGNRLYLLLYSEVQFQASDFIDFKVTTYEGKPAVGFSLAVSSAPRFAAMTEGLINETEYGKDHGKLAVFVNGAFESAPRVNNVISDNGVITLGGTDVTELDKKAKNLQISLQSGALNTPIALESEISTGPAIGEDSLRRGIISMVLSAGLVLLFMAVYYLALGCVADFAMMLNIPLILGALCAFQATFTLPGFAGLILTLGMSVDANILIYERIREEKAAGKGLEGAFKAGYDRAFTTIIDSHITTLIVGLILMWKGTGPIRGFGITLTVGIATSLFTALLITKVIFTILIKAGWIKQARMLRWVKRPHIPWMKYRHIAVTCSILLSVIGIAFFVARGTTNFGIDFLGGAQYHLNLTTPIQIEDARAKLAEIAPPNSNVEVQSVQSPSLAGGKAAGGGSYEFIIRFSQDVISKIGEQSGAPKNADTDTFVSIVEGKLRDVFSAEFPPEGIDMPLAETRFSQISLTFKPKESTMPNFRDAVQFVLSDKFKRDVPEKIPEEAYTVTLPYKFTGGEKEGVMKELKEKCDQNSLKLEDITNLNNDPGATIVVYEIFEVPQGLNEEQRAEFLNKIPPAVEEAIAANSAGKEGKPYTVGKVEFIESLQKGEKQYAKYRIETTCTDFYGTATKKLDAIMRKNLLEKPIALAGGVSAPLVVSPGGISYKATVASSVAQSLRYTALFSLILAMAGIIVYVWFRFRQFRYGFGAVVALLHDVTVAIGVVALLDTITPLNVKFELTVVAALLTIIGYSVMDTIVVFDRIRENLGQHREEKYFIENVDNSINQTLTRTIFTSLTVFLTVFTLAILGGEMVRGFAITMCIGVFVGTYSSIFIASPVVVWLHNRELRALGLVQSAPAGAQK